MLWSFYIYIVSLFIVHKCFKIGSKLNTKILLWYMYQKALLTYFNLAMSDYYIFFNIRLDNQQTSYYWIMYNINRWISQLLKIYILPQNSEHFGIPQLTALLTLFNIWIHCPPSIQMTQVISILAFGKDVKWGIETSLMNSLLLTSLFVNGSKNW